MSCLASDTQWRDSVQCFIFLFLCFAVYISIRSSLISIGAFFRSVSCESDVTRVESIYRAWWRSDRSSVGCWSRGSFISESTTRSSHTRRHWMLPIAYIACILFASGSLSLHWWNRGVGLYPFSLALFLKSIVYCQYYTSSIFPSLEVDYRAEKKRPPFSKIHGGHYQVYDVHTSITKHITRVI